jgi:hypothetical protein
MIYELVLVQDQEIIIPANGHFCRPPFIFTYDKIMTESDSIFWGMNSFRATLSYQSHDDLIGRLTSIELRSRPWLFKITFEVEYCSVHAWIL